ncbi:MAG: tetratricopeptide repeat protein [Prevotellaceae bacterium]|jgi:tetratricopeptide (TPR) repeat protein|nr:tetratricopeptide repeat protein [Prevotellaceae bacterium]
MKTLLITIALLCSMASFAQTGKYISAMKESIAMQDSVKTKEDMLSLSNMFERIAKAEKDKWQPYYYAALQQILRCYQMQGAEAKNIDVELNRADELLAHAEVISPENSELICLKSMIASGRMMVDYITRTSTYGPKAAQLLTEAIKLNPNNPRAYLLLGQNLFYTPATFGGGKDKAKPILEKSVQLFETFEPATELDPIWGKGMAMSMLKQCE